MLVRVLDHDDGGVDHGADGDGDAAEAHDVGRQAERVHAGVGDQHAERQRDDGDQRAAHVQQEDDADQRDDEAFLDKRGFERGDGALDEVGAVVDGNDLGAVRQAVLDLGKARLDVLDDRQRILPIALDGDAGDHLALAIQLGDAAPLVGRKLDAGHVAQQHGRAAFGLEHDLFDIARCRADSRGRAP